MSMYNLIEYSKNYSKKSGGLWNYYRDDPNDPITDPEPFKLQEVHKMLMARKKFELLYH